MVLGLIAAELPLDTRVHPPSQSVPGTSSSCVAPAPSDRGDGVIINLSLLRRRLLVRLVHEPENDIRITLECRGELRHKIVIFLFRGIARQNFLSPCVAIIMRVEDNIDPLVAA
jgi:hypothetical protein